MREISRDRKAYHNEKIGHGTGEHGKKGQKSDVVVTAKYTVKHSIELMTFLLEKCSTSRNNVKSLLTNRQVLVNGSPVTQYNFMLAKDDEVKISKYSVSDAVKRSAPAEKKTEKRERPPRLKIIYEDDDFIAIDKPAGLLSVESDTERECAFMYVFNHLQALDKTVRPYILHRIDKETSGVLVFAKNVKVHSMLRLNWNDFVDVREYCAVVEGKMEKSEDTIISYLRENKNNLVYSTHDPSGQKAITHYTVTAENENFSMLRVKIDTGRKNQIRVHMHDLGHPVVGDEKYGFTKNPLKRLGLHASMLVFRHPVTKEVITIKAGVPETFRSLFKK